MPRTKQELIAECTVRNVQYSSEWGRERLEEALADKAELPQIKVMLARDFKDVSEPQRKAILSDGSWLSEEKLDGVRMKVHVTPNGLRLDGRRKSDTTHIYTERTQNFPHFRDCRLFDGLEGVVFDAELVMLADSIDTGSVITSGTLTSTTAITNCAPERSHAIQKKFGRASLCIFDIVYWRGTRIAAPFSERRCHIEKIFDKRGITALGESKIYRLPQRHDPVNHFKEVTEAGGEGVMLKHANGKYDYGKRSKTLLKWKRVYTTDAFVVGYVPANKGKGWDGLVGALEVAIFDDRGEQVGIGAVQPGTLETRKEVTAPDGSLRKEYYGRVVEIRGQDWTKNLRLRHCVLLKWRPDKGKEECTLDMKTLRKKMQQFTA